MLPKNEKRNVNKLSQIKIWIYGAPFSGKTTLANNFPDALMLNTDGNINSFNSPYVRIRDELDGRQTIKAWVIFKRTIEELKQGSEYKTIVVDLVEDAYEYCRLYCYEKLGIEHESDNSFKAYDYVRTEFLNVMKSLVNLNYNIVLISHEDTSKDITKRSGDKITAIKPNITEKLANKLAGMVDLVGRVTNRKLSFYSDEVVFGGGRIKLNKTEIPLDFNALIDIYKG